MDDQLQKKRNIIIVILVCSFLLCMFFPLKHFFKPVGVREYVKPSVFSYHGLQAYSRKQAYAHPEKAKFYLLLFPYLMLNLSKVVMFLGFSFLLWLVHIFVSMENEIGAGARAPNGEFKVGWGFADILSVFILAIAVHSVSIVMWEDIMADDIKLWVIIETLLQSLLLGGFVLVHIIHVKNVPCSNLGISLPKPDDFIMFVVKIAVILFCFSAVLSFLIDYNFLPEGNWTELFKTGSKADVGGVFKLIQFSMFIFFAPVSEELFFRGLLYPVSRNMVGPKLGAVLVSILFSLLHMNFVSAFILFFFSYILCRIYEAKRNIFYNIALHTLYNIFMSTGMVVDLIR